WYFALSVVDQILGLFPRDLCSFADDDHSSHDATWTRKHIGWLSLSHRLFRPLLYLSKPKIAAGSCTAALVYFFPYRLCCLDRPSDLCIVVASKDRILASWSPVRTRRGLCFNHQSFRWGLWTSDALLSELRG